MAAMTLRRAQSSLWPCRHAGPARRNISATPVRSCATDQTLRRRKPETGVIEGLEHLARGAGIGACRIGAAMAKSILNDIDVAAAAHANGLLRCDARHGIWCCGVCLLDPGPH